MVFNVMLLAVFLGFVGLTLGQEKVCFDAPSAVAGSDNFAISDACLGCICEASTRCNLTAGCISGGALCGPFLLSRPFWVDAGKCLTQDIAPTDPLAFEKCASDLSCASKTLRSYLHAFAKDCNGDQLVTCDDYVMLHKNGGYQCSTPVETKFWNIYTECRELVLSNGANI